MFVGCTDCGKRLGYQSVERPKSVKLGMKSTTEVCKRCRVLWYLKQARIMQRHFDKGELVDATPIRKYTNMAIKFLEEL